MSKIMQRRTFNPERVKRHFADVPGYYDYWAKATESRASRRILELADIKKNQTVLEAGVGTGILFEEIIEQNSQGFTAGIDLSSAMLGKAESRTARWKSSRYFTPQEGSAYDLSFEDKTFDCLISCYMLDLLPEKDFVDILMEFRRVLKPGGRLLLASMSPGWTWYHHFWTWMTKTFPELMTDCRPVKLKPFVEKAGFKIETVEKISQNTFPSELIKATK